MFLILVSYKKPLEEIDRLLADHRQFLARHFASGHFLFAGRQEPRTGGLILAQAKDKAEVEAIIAQDPFKTEGAAEYQIIEFVAAMTADALAAFKEA